MTERREQRGKAGREPHREGEGGKEDERERHERTAPRHVGDTPARKIERDRHGLLHGVQRAVSTTEK